MPLAILGGLFQHKDLVWLMIRRDVVERYRGSVFGILWSFFNPILLLAVYTFVFGVIFKARWGVNVNGGTGEFAIILFAGLIVHALFSECVTRAPGLVLSNPSYVKKVVFPLEILPWVSMGSALFHALVNVIVLLIFYLALDMTLNWTIMLFPLVLFPLVILTMGVSWFLASTGVFLRDIGQVIGIITTILLFLSPVFYSTSSIDEKYQWAMYFNPLTFIIQQMRAVLLWGELPNFVGLGIYLLLSLFVAWFGIWWFQKTQKSFADVL